MRSPTSPSPGPRAAACLLVLVALGAASLGTPTGATEPATSRRTTVEADDTLPTRRILAVTSEGLAGIGAPEWHEAGHKGAGTKVAIIDP
ncbi:MAG: hypothetical protein MK184_11365, partial [Acidimicrobiales bacterium]|nr:hypothetical protein [Acidimicrobiales bacterium]